VPVDSSAFWISPHAVRSWRKRGNTYSIWIEGESGISLTLVAHGDTLEGTADHLADVVYTGAPPRMRARARRYPCGSER
jgi:hypothetical protein